MSYTMLWIVTLAVSDESPGGPYCGVYSVYTCLSALGVKSDFSTLLERRYVGSSLGSSLGELRLAAEDHGVSALAIQGMTKGTLESCRWPVILHLRNNRDSRVFDHWAVFLGVEDGKARILDPPGIPALVDFSHLLARWDGIGLIVSAKPVSRWEVVRSEVETFSGYTALTICLLAFAFLIGKDCALSRFIPISAFTTARPGAQLAMLLIASVTIGVAYHWISDVGFLQNPSAVAFVLKSHCRTYLPTLSASDVDELRSAHGTFLVDARFASDFGFGHIEGAINVSVDSTTEEKLRRLNDVPKSARLIVYCQSVGCAFDEEVATELSLCGFTRLSLFPGGWREWKAYVNEANQPARSTK